MVLNFSIRNGKRWFHHCMNVDIDWVFAKIVKHKNSRSPYPICIGSQFESLRCFEMKAIKTQNHPTIDNLYLSQWEHHGIAHHRDRYGFDEFDYPIVFPDDTPILTHSIASSYIVNMLGGSTSHIPSMNDSNKNSYQWDITTESTLSVWKQCARVKSTSILFVPYIILPEWNLSHGEFDAIDRVLAKGKLSKEMELSCVNGEDIDTSPIEQDSRSKESHGWYN